MGLAPLRASYRKANAKFPIGLSREKVIDELEELLAYYRDDSDAIQNGNAESSIRTTERRHFRVA
jgi:hypothetical protein